MDIGPSEPGSPASMSVDFASAAPGLNPAAFLGSSSVSSTAHYPQVRRLYRFQRRACCLASILYTCKATTGSDPADVLLMCLCAKLSEAGVSETRKGGVSQKKPSEERLIGLQVHSDTEAARPGSAQERPEPCREWGSMAESTASAEQNDEWLPRSSAEDQDALGPEQFLNFSFKNLELLGRKNQEMASSFRALQEEFGQEDPYNEK